MVFQADGDVTKVEGLPQAIDSLARQFDTFRVGSTFASGSDAYLSQDRHDHLRDVLSAGCVGCVERHGRERLEELREAARDAAPPGVTTSVTGIEALHDSQGAGSEGSGVLIEALIGGAGALLILLFVFGTLPAVVMPLLVALASILNTFTLRVDPHLLHVGFVDRPIPRRARRPRRRDRLCAAR